MEFVRRIDRAGRLQQLEGRPAGAPRRLDHRLVLRRVLVGLEQDAVKLLAHWRRAGAAGELACPGVDLGRDLALALDPEQGRFNDLLRRLPEVALAEPAEVVRGGEQAEQRRRLLLGAGRFAEIVRGQLGEAKSPSGANSQARSRSISAASVEALASSVSGSGLAKRNSTLAALTLARLPEPSSTCSELSVSLITRPAWNLPASS